MNEQGDESVVGKSIAKKKKVRGGHKVHLRKLFSSVTELCQSEEIEDSAELIALRSCLERKTALMGRLDEEIIENIESEEEMAAEIESAESLQNDIRKRIIWLDRKLESENQKKGRVGTARNNGSEVSSAERKPNTVKLPKIEIPKFAGDPKDYRPFRDSYDVSVHNRDDISIVEKFTYLKSYLVEDAAKSIKGLSLTERNYKEALEILERRYGNKQVIVNSHMEELIKINSISTSGDPKKLRDLYDRVESNLRSLRSLDIDPESYGCLLVPVLRNKLPNDLRLVLNRKFNSNTEVWKITELMHELKIEIEARERCIQNKSDNREKKDKYENSFTTTEALFVRDHIHCPYCQQKHFPDKCNIVTNVETRRNLLKSQSRCFLCTRKGHNMRECRSKKSCFRCNSRHHTSLCDQIDQVKERRKKERVDDVKEENNDNTSVNLSMSENNVILMQTAEVNVGSNSKSGNKVKCKLLFDSGSQRSYILKRIQDKVKSPVVRREFISISSFGGKDSKPRYYDVVKVMLKGRRHNSHVSVEAVVVEDICSHKDIGVGIEDIQADHIKKLDLADDYENENELELGILIGMDNYWSLVTGFVVKGIREPVAMETVFGFVLSGTMETGQKHLSILKSNNNCRSFVSMLISSLCKENDISSNLYKFWETDSIGIKTENIIERKFNKNLKVIDGKYCVSIPFKDG